MFAADAAVVISIIEIRIRIGFFRLDFPYIQPFGARNDFRSTFCIPCRRKKYYDGFGILDRKSVV